MRLNKIVKILIWKEYLASRPYILFLLAIYLISLVYYGTTQYLENSFSELFNHRHGFTEAYFLLMYLLCVGLHTKDYDGRTQHFMDGLPVPRFLTYTIKSLLPIVIISLYFFADIFLLLLISLSIDNIQMFGKWLYPLVITSMTQIIIFGSLLGTLSFLRRWSLLVLVFLFFTFVWLKKMGIQNDSYNIFAIANPPESPDQAWLIPWGQVGGFLLGSTLLWIIGLILFQIRYLSFGRFQTLIAKKFSSKLATVFFVILLISGIFGLLKFSITDYLIEDLSKKTHLPKRDPGQKIIQKKTKHFDFTFVQKHRKILFSEPKKWDQAYQKVTSYLKMPVSFSSTRIQVDACNPLMKHTVGRAFWKKMQIDPRRNRDQILQTFSHELTHVVIDLITDHRLFDNFAYCRWFHEGLATYVENRFFGNFTYEYKHLALAGSWDEVHFNELFDDKKLGEKRDRDLVYPMGMLWIEALVIAYGDDSPSKLLEVIARKDAYREISSQYHWQSICQDAGFNLEKVRSVFYQRLEEIKKEYREWSQPFNEITQAEILREGSDLTVKPELTESWIKVGKAGGKIIIRLASVRGDETPSQFTLNKENTLSKSYETRLKNRIYYQIGIVTDKAQDRAIYGEWVEHRF